MTIWRHPARALGALCLTLAIGLALAAPSARAEGRPLADFSGEWSGVGVSEDAEDLGGATNVQTRTSYVAIEPDDKGFALKWTTIRDVEAADIQTLRLKSAERRFVATDNPAYFKGAESGHALAGKTTSWAHIEGASLFVTELIVQPDGTYDLASYERKLTDDGGMDVVFTRVRNGEITRRAVLVLQRYVP
ncbi:MAG: hypothetical protein HXY25_00915 [Alphaproteobacteria bacterium]|nr:hypothetical protein [Alphaproteobacteria bacterium]